MSPLSRLVAKTALDKPLSGLLVNTGLTRMYVLKRLVPKLHAALLRREAVSQSSTLFVQAPGRTASRFVRLERMFLAMCTLYEAVRRSRHYSCKLSSKT
jgi:hypothetical protein